MTSFSIDWWPKGTGNLTQLDGDGYVWSAAEWRVRGGATNATLMPLHEEEATLTTMALGAPPDSTRRREAHVVPLGAALA